MTRIAGFALAAAMMISAVGTASAESLGPTALGGIFCSGVMKHDMTDVLPWLTPDFAAKIAAATAAKGAAAIHWQSTTGANNCMPVGAQGTAEVPEAIIYYTWSDQSHSGYSDRLVIRFVNDESRIDDVKFPDGSTLRQQLGTP